MKAENMGPMAQVALSKMDESQKKAFFYMYKDKEYSTAVAYFCLFFFACHHAYLGHWGRQILFWLTGGGLLFWWIADLIMMYGWVKEANRELSDKLIVQYKAVTA